MSNLRKYELYLLVSEIQMKGKLQASAKAQNFLVYFGPWHHRTLCEGIKIDEKPPGWSSLSWI